MRSLETLLLMADLLTLFVLSFARCRAPRWTRLAATVAKPIRPTCARYMKASRVPGTS